MERTLKTVLCPICQSATRVFGVLPETKQLGRLEIHRCVDCGHILIPKSHLQVTAFAEEMIDRGDASSLTARWVFEKLPKVDVHNKSIRVLDVGCWTGELLEVLPAHWEKEGVELNNAAVAIAREKGYMIYEEKVEALNGREKYYDLIFMMDVLEHVSDPKASLKPIEHMLAPGGLFIALTGNAESVASRVFKGAWYYFNYPEHITFFSPDSLNIILKEVGLIPVRTDRVIHHSTSLRGTLSKIWKRLIAPKALGQAGLADTLSVRSKIVMSLSRVLRGRDHLFVIAKKPEL